MTFKKIISINLFFLIILLVIVEVLLGNWIKNFFSKDSNYSTKLFPGLIKNRKIIYNAANLYNSDKPVIVKIIKDQSGYRSRNLDEKSQ